MDVKIKTIADIYKTSFDYIRARQTGKTRSIMTPWATVNDAGVNGFEWGTIITLAGRPGTGKTSFANQFTRSAHALNPDMDFHIMDFQFEMPDKQTGVREFSNVTGKKYAELLSAERPVGDDTLKVIIDYIRSNKDRPIFIVDVPMTVLEMEAFLLKYYEDNNYTPLIVTIDHATLVKVDKAHDTSGKFGMLDNLGEMMTRLKKRMSIIFIVLTQMNRSIEDSARKQAGTIGNFPTSSDIYGSDALVQHSDMVLVLNNPAKSLIREYGPDRIKMTPDMIAGHFVKSRNGMNMLGFFQFNGTDFTEIPQPGTAQLNTAPPQLSGFKRKP